jgi:two-component system sensor kinase FixL
MKMAKKIKTKKTILQSSAHNDERRHFARRASDKNKTRRYMGDKIRQQADELTIKNGQLKNGVEKQIRSDEQIHMHTKAMESTADGIFIIDAQKADFPIIYANQAFQKMTGYAKREIIGRNCFLFHGIETDSRIVEEIKHTLSKGKYFHGEMLNFKKDGTKYWNSLRIAPVRDAKGAVTHYVGIQTDVTLMRDKELEIDEQREELLHVTRVGKLAEFVSSLAHEISQPLTAILSYAQAAQRMLADREPELQKILAYIISDNHRASEVIQRLRLLLKKGTPEMKPIDINALINETVALIATDATVRNDVLKLELESDLPPVRGDVIQLQQVLLNLISNSFDAMENSLDPRDILIRTSRKNTGTIMVAVKDSGCGIPAKNIPKLFTHFFTSKPDGLGMGLSISRSIIEAHGGVLDVENNPDRGVTFYFTIPVDIKDTK